MKLYKKLIAGVLGTVMLLSGCGAANAGTITVVSREDGSGTRGAFIELFGVEEKNDKGEKVDNTTLDAVITNSTSVVLTTVAKDTNAIGYISLGSLNDTVKAAKIDGAVASAENVKNGTYKIARPFNVVTKPENNNEAAQDFLNFIASKDGAKVIEDNKYISVTTNEFTSTQASGKVVIAGSSSVTPVMEKLKEAYATVNPNATIEIQQSDSTTGVQSAIDGIADIGMASREIKESELSKGIKSQVIAMDGIAVIINKDNEVETLTKEQVKEIFTGKVTTWADVK